MKRQPHLGRLLGGLILAVGFATLFPLQAPAQWQALPALPPVQSSSQRNSLVALRSQVTQLQNSTRTAASYGAQGPDNIWQQFQLLRSYYDALKQSLTQQQMAQGANAFAELDAGLNIIQEAFANYQQDVSAGRSPSAARNELCQVMRDASRVWLQELNKRCSQLRIGWGS